MFSCKNLCRGVHGKRRFDSLIDCLSFPSEQFATRRGVRLIAINFVSKTNSRLNHFPVRPLLISASGNFPWTFPGHLPDISSGPYSSRVIPRTFRLWSVSYPVGLHLLNLPMSVRTVIKSNFYLNKECVSNQNQINIRLIGKISQLTHF